MANVLQIVLVLLATSVLVVVVFRSLHLPPLLGYLIVGLAVGPHALGWIAEGEATRYLGEFGVVFLMFTIGLEFSIGKLGEMRRLVFGLGGTQVIVTLAVVAAGFLLAGENVATAISIGGAIAMSSTAIVVRLLHERRALETPHGREAVGVLLFQDLAVVPLLILVPALAGEAATLGATLGFAFVKAAVVLAVLLFGGQPVMRWWFHLVAARRSHELFILNVLLITLALAWVTELAGLSLVLGAFVAGMLISETEYRHQVEEDIKPFREVLLGLFFVTVGMQLDLGLVLDRLGLVFGLFVAQLALKAGIVFLLSRAFGSPTGVALRSALTLAQAGEFGLVLMSLALGAGVVPEPLAQAVVASMVLTMFAAPFLIQHSDRIVMRVSRSEWMMQSLALHQLAVRSIAREHHVIVCGFGRTGQALARFLAEERIGYIALDLDPERVREADVAGESVVFGDAARREILLAAGLNRASAVVITYADAASALKVLHHVRSINATVPVIVRTIDDADLERLTAAGATEVVPETFEASLMLASHALVLLGVPVRRVVGRIRAVREARYALLRGFFHGESDAHDTFDESAQPRLHSVVLREGAHALGRTLAELDLAALHALPNAVRRGEERMSPPPATLRLELGDVVVLMGDAEAVGAAEMRLTQGG
jgi:CPA2 family monovalent cation:H+ antiporter-2